ncbi:unnamed protein product [Arabis nemorensis]|uniref:Uncharacterized protein n=1 Tax=Arabis nemorensis TaxID=586526 RepID=A0A565CA47_9BRAS|nr:unnamed protein product [Arabis nemorensis]
MERRLMIPGFFWLILDLVLRVSGNAQGDALIALKNSLADPNKMLQSWDATLVTPCTWFHVTCNSDSVTRVDLGNANLSGQLVMQLGQLPNLQYLKLYSNNITGGIPKQLGNLTELVSLDLYLNNLSSPIPSTLGRLKKLCILRLNNNNLSGEIPRSLTAIATLQVLDLSNNPLTGDIPVNGSFSLFTFRFLLLVEILFCQHQIESPSYTFASSSLSPTPPSPSVGIDNLTWEFIFKYCIDNLTWEFLLLEVSIGMRFDRS